MKNNFARLTYVICVLPYQIWHSPIYSWKLLQSKEVQLKYQFRTWVTVRVKPNISWFACVFLLRTIYRDIPRLCPCICWVSKLDIECQHSLYFVTLWFFNATKNSDIQQNWEPRVNINNCFTSKETFFSVYFGCFSQSSSMDCISRSCHMTYKLEYDWWEFVSNVSV